jgi:hypothetical protein
MYKFDKQHTDIFITYNFAKGKITAKTDKFEIGDNESSLTNDDKEEGYEKFNSERDKLKKKLYGLKNDSITNFNKIEDEYIKQLIEQTEYLNKIQNNKNYESNKILFDQKILVKNIFDEDMSEVIIF